MFELTNFCKVQKQTNVVSGEEIHGNDVEGVLAFKQAWPSMCRTVWGAHKRYMETYLDVYKGYYFTGDGAARDEHGYIWIKGRVDGACPLSCVRAPC